MERKKQLTASNFVSVTNRREHIEPKLIFKIIFTEEKVKSAACDWGIQNKQIHWKSMQ